MTRLEVESNPWPPLCCVDMAVKNAGIGAMPKPVQEITAANWDRTINVTLRGTYLAMQTQIAHFRRTVLGAC